MKKLTLPAKIKALDELIGLVDNAIAPYSCPPAEQMNIELAAEEIFVNIASYAYAPEEGEAEIGCLVEGEPPVLTMVFTDSGRAFDPLAGEDADTSRDALLAREGGLGILLVKKMMDEVDYVRVGGRNVLTVRKKLHPVGK